MTKNLLWLTALLGAAVAHGSSLCTSGTLASYETLAGGCSVGSYTFSDFSFLTSGSMPAIDASNVQVQVFDDGSTQGLTFTGPFSANIGLSLDILIAFVITGPTFTSDTLTMLGGATSAGGSAQVAESICLGGAPAPNGYCAGGTESLDVFANGGGTQSSATAKFSGVTSIGVTKDLILQGGMGSASIRSVTNAVPSAGGGGPGGGGVPEPETSILVGTGLLGSALLLRRKLKA